MHELKIELEPKTFRVLNRSSVGLQKTPEVVAAQIIQDVLCGKPVTLRDVAKKAGVAVMTASYSLSNSLNQVSPDTARHVQAVAEAMGYRRSPWLLIRKKGVKSRDRQNNPDNY